MTQAAPAVLVVRPRAQAGAWVTRLQAAGIAAHALPLIGIEPAPDAGALDLVWAALAEGGVALAVFVSPNAVAGFFAPAHARWPPQVLAGATGPGTVAALREAGVPQACIVAPPPQVARFDSEALWEALRARPWQDREVWIVRGNGGREWLGDQLRAAGARLHWVQSYTRVEPRLDPAEAAVLAQACARPRDFIWLFGSSEAIDHLSRLAPGAGAADACAFATHERIAARARTAGFGRVVQVAPTPEAVAAAVTEAAAVAPKPGRPE